jgi:tetratricopeptide (TPR) repeat protein
LKDKKVRDQLREKNLAMIEEGMKYLEKALELDPQYDDAMAYMNLLYRQRADLQETQEAYKRDWDTADNWVQKTLETKKMKTGGTAATAGGGTQ